MKTNSRLEMAAAEAATLWPLKKNVYIFNGIFLLFQLRLEAVDLLKLNEGRNFFVVVVFVLFFFHFFSCTHNGLAISRAELHGFTLTAQSLCDQACRASRRASHLDRPA